MLESVRIRDPAFECFYQDVGDGPPLAMAHGFSANHLSWWQQLPVFGEEFRCIAPDQRSFGLSRDPRNRGVAAFADDLLALLDAAGVDRTALLGHSMGGWPVGSVATQHPERVAALVLSATPGGLIPPERHRELMEAGADEVADIDPPAPPKQFLAGAIGDLNRHAPEEWEDVRPTLDELPLDADTVVDADIPVLLVVGEGDPFMPPPAVDAVADRLDAETAVVPGAAHSVYVEQPEAFNRHVLEFLEERATF
jgi:pimeloyl-ACP methyl ester carboxylesterase